LIDRSGENSSVIVRHELTRYGRRSMIGVTASNETTTPSCETASHHIGRRTCTWLMIAMPMPMPVMKHISITVNE
jgi:hypothetical protein